MLWIFEQAIPMNSYPNSQLEQNSIIDSEVEETLGGRYMMS